MQAVACRAGGIYEKIIADEIQQIRGIEKESCDWLAQTIVQESVRYGVQPLLIAAIIKIESGYQPGAVSSAGAVGFMQLMPDTAAQLGVNPYAPDQNLAGGTKYFAQQLQAFSDMGEYQTAYALAAYNAGPNAVKKGMVYGETIQYVYAVIQEYKNLIDKLREEEDENP